MSRTRKRIQTAAFAVLEYEMKWEGTYRPCISPEHLRRLWLLKQDTGKPITQLVADALDYYFEHKEGGEKAIFSLLHYALKGLEPNPYNSGCSEENLEQVARERGVLSIEKSLDHKD